MLEDTLGRIAFYIGVPTVEFRTVQSELARMTGHVMRVAYVGVDESGCSGVVAPRPIVYEPLIGGATAYGSVFGYCTSGVGEDVCRFDDHFEVYEFLALPDLFAPTVLLLLGELILPTLYVARKRVVRGAFYWHGQHQLIVADRHDLRPALARAGIPEKSKVTDDRLDPITFLGVLYETLVPKDNASPQQSDEYGKLMSMIVEEARNWASSDLKPSSVSWFRDSPTDREDEHVENYGRIRLPTVSIRLLLHLACTWLFYGAAPTMRSALKGRMESPWEDNNRKTRDLLKRTDEVLYQLREHWIFDRNYFVELSAGPETTDPLINAILWLAFVHDYIATVMSSEGGEEETRTDPLAHEEQEQVTLSRSWFDDFARELKLHGWEKGPPQEASGSGDDEQLTYSYWRARFNAVERLNDTCFPDSHLVHAWSLLFRLLNPAQVVVPLDENNQPSWSEEVSKGAENSVDWWVHTGRQWSEAPAMARDWLAPLMLEAVYTAASVSCEDLDSESSLRGRDLLQCLFKSRRQSGESDRDTTLGALHQIAKDCVAGYPLRFAPRDLWDEHDANVSTENFIRALMDPDRPIRSKPAATGHTSPNRGLNSS